MSTNHSRVYQTCKTKYRVSNSAECDKALVNRGRITFWIFDDAIKKWNAKTTKKRGGQAKNSDLPLRLRLLWDSSFIFYFVKLKALSGRSSSSWSCTWTCPTTPCIRAAVRRLRSNCVCQCSMAWATCSSIAPDFRSLAKANWLPRNTVTEASNDGRIYPLELTNLGTSSPKN